jgi:hypothetical protein
MYFKISFEPSLNFPLKFEATLLSQAPVYSLLIVSLQEKLNFIRDFMDTLYVASLAQEGHMVSWIGVQQ